MRKSRLIPGRVSFTQLAHREGVAPGTPWRWTLNGVRGVKLRSVRVGGRRYVLDEDWAAFSTALNADLQASPPPSAPAAKGCAAQAGRELDRLFSRRGSKANA